jgi:signal transduction histidine kinase
VAARTLEARLTLRLLALTGSVLVAVAFAAVLVTDRALDAGDARTARAAAEASWDALGRELDEGDGPDEALAEVIAAADTEGVRLVATTAGHTRSTARAERLSAVNPGMCQRVDDEHIPWLACAVADARATAVAAIPVGEHRATVRVLLRWMLGVVVLGLAALGLAVRQALRAPIAELTSLVSWTDRIVDAESVLPPPPAETREIERLEVAFDALVRRLLDELARVRANSAHIAHELRTPLTSILAELDALENAKEEAAIARIRGDVGRLADVIDAILVLSDPRAKGRTGTIINVADLARELAPRGAAVEAPDEALIDADQRLVALAIRNLVDNAEKHGRGVLAVRVTRDEGRVRVTVQDGGAGLDANAREQMFERYWRASADGAGRGLGLALVRAVAERYGGQADAAPGEDGVGLCVSLTLDGLVRWHDLEPLGRRDTLG